MSQPLGFFPTTDRSKSVKAEDENYFDGEEGELWKPALLWRLVLCWWCRSTPHTVQKWISLFQNYIMLVAPFWDPKLGYIFWVIFFVLFFGLFFDQVFDHFLKFDFGLFWTVVLDLLGFLYIFFQKNDKSKSVKAQDENYFDGEEGELWKLALLWRLVQEYAAHCSKMDKFVQKLFYARCPLLGSKIRIHFFWSCIVFWTIESWFFCGGCGAGVCCALFKNE